MFVTGNIGATRGFDDDFWYGPVGGVTSSGVTVSVESAARLSTVYKCVRVRAETIGMLPLMVYERLAGGGKRAATDHPLYPLLHDAPNPWMTSSQWRQAMQAWVDLRGNAYSQVVYAGSGRADMLVPMPADRVRIEVLPNGEPRYIYSGNGGEQRTFVRGEVLHITGLTMDGYCGLNPIEAQREALGAAIAARDYGSRYFSQAPRTSLWIKMAGKFATPDDRRRYAKDFADGYGGMNSGKVPVMEDGKEIQSIPALNNADAQFIENRKYADVDICGLFRMPPHKVGILDRATWGNIEHQQLDFVTDTIMPPCVAWEQALLRDLDFGDGYFAEFKLSGLLRGDTTSRYSAYSRGINDGWLTRNEARASENLNPLDGLDEPLQPLNMTTASAAPTQAGPSGERRALLLTAAAERVARKECAMWRKGAEVGAEHARWVSEVLAVSESTAMARAAALPGIFADADTKTTDGDFLADRVAELLRLE